MVKKNIISNKKVERVPKEEEEWIQKNLAKYTAIEKRLNEGKGTKMTVDEFREWGEQLKKEFEKLPRPPNETKLLNAAKKRVNEGNYLTEKQAKKKLGL